MSGFALHLYAADHAEVVDNVVSFVGEDRTGSFSLWPRHERFMTMLVFGLARFRLSRCAEWEYLALPGGLLYFVDNELRLATREYFRHSDYAQMERHLHATLQRQEAEFTRTREQLQRLEQEMLQRLWRLKRSTRA
jgi:F-type H+-transporting ATPase subunit epsilon